MDNSVKLSRVYMISAVTSIVLTLVLYILFPRLRATFLAEDQTLENLTAIIFFIGFSLGLTAVVRLKGSRYRLAYAIIPLLAFVSFVDEVGFGLRLFQLKLSALHGIDGFHDSFNLLEDLLGGYFIALFGMGCILALILTVKFKDMLSAWPPVKLVASSLGLVLIALIIDADMMHFGPWLFLIEELAELNAALALAFASLLMPSGVTLLDRGASMPRGSRGDHEPQPHAAGQR